MNAQPITVEEVNQLPSDPASIVLRAIDCMYGIYMQMYISDSIRISCQESMEQLLTQYFVYDQHPSALVDINQLIVKHAKGKGDGIVEKFSVKAADIYTRVQTQLTEKEDGNS